VAQQAGFGNSVQQVRKSLSKFRKSFFESFYVSKLHEKKPNAVHFLLDLRLSSSVNFSRRKRFYLSRTGPGRALLE